MTDHRAERPKRNFSVGATIQELGGGRLRVVLDDLLALGALENETWKKRSLFTHFDLDRSQSLAHQLSAAEYGRIGELLLARLIALSIDDSQEGTTFRQAEEP